MAFILLLLSLAPDLQASAPPPSQLVRVFLHTDDGGHPDELAARRQSLVHLRDALSLQKYGKTLVMVNDEDGADVVIDVVERGVVVPKVVFGLGAMGSQPGRPAPVAAPTRHVKLKVTIGIARHADPAGMANANRATESEAGWISAAADIAKQADKWIAGRRDKIIEARRGRF